MFYLNTGSLNNLI